ncbi:MAG: hypothetical protein ACM3RX_04340 [Methanococcaceae archaeon]
MDGVILKTNQSPGHITIQVKDFNTDSIINAVANYLGTESRYLKRIKPELIAILGNAPQEILSNHGMIRESGLGSEDMPVIFEVRKTLIII